MVKFWYVEESTAAPLAFTEEGRCKDIFVTEHQRTASGRIALPLVFLDSRAIAVKRFESPRKKTIGKCEITFFVLQFYV